MRKFKFQQTSKLKPSTTSGSKMIDSDLEEIKLLMDLRKTSTLFKTAARKKIEEVLKNLDQKPIKEWTK